MPFPSPVPTLTSTTHVRCLCSSPSESHLCLALEKVTARPPTSSRCRVPCPVARPSPQPTSRTLTSLPRPAPPGPCFPSRTQRAGRRPGGTDPAATNSPARRAGASQRSSSWRPWDPLPSKVLRQQPQPLQERRDGRLREAKWPARRSPRRAGRSGEPSSVLRTRSPAGSSRGAPPPAAGAPPRPLEPRLYSRTPRPRGRMRTCSLVLTLAGPPGWAGANVARLGRQAASGS